MNDIAAIYSVMATLMCVLVLGCLCTGGWRSFAASVVLGVLIVALPGSMIQTLGRPLPVEFNFSCTVLDADAEVLWFGFAEGRAIYVLIAHEPPCYLSLPWSEKEASGLQEAAETVKKGGGMIKMRKGENGTPGSNDEREQMFYPEAQPPLPPKDQQP